MNSWQKISHPKKSKSKAPPYWLEVRNGKRGVRYRVVYRGEGVKLRKVLSGKFEKWEDARKVAETLIANLKYGEKPKPRNLITSESLCDEIVELKKSKDPSTYDKAESFFRLHIKPFLSQECPYAADLNSTVWLKYRSEYRIKFPERPLFDHWKFWVQLFKTANEKGIIPKAKLDFNEKRDDDRKSGQIIKDDQLLAFLAVANPKWQDRTKLQRLCGQRPGVIRRLKKDFVNFETGVVSIPKLESKNRRSYEFKLPAMALNILKSRIENGSPYFFPNGENKTQPMVKHLGGWHSAWKKAGITMGFTPHDIRHTFLTEKVNTPGTNLAVLCYSCDLSLDELMKTYVHFKAEDTQAIADASETKGQSLFGTPSDTP